MVGYAQADGLAPRVKYAPLAIKGAGMPDAVDGKDLLVANSLSQAGGTIFQAGGAIAAVGGAIIAPSGALALMAVVCYGAAGFFARGIARLDALWSRRPNSTASCTGG